MRKSNARRIIAFGIAFTVLALGLGARTVGIALGIAILGDIYIWSHVVAAIILVSILAGFFLENHIYKGIHYFYYYFTVKNKLEKQMMDAGFGIQRSYYIELPKIELSFDRDFKAGMLKVGNTIKYDKRLDDVVLSSALNKFIVERHYLSDDGNYYIYELIDGSVSFKLTFDSFKDFDSYSQKVDRYKLFLDSRTWVKLQHTLLIGLTGSGKTYALYSLILQMLHKKTPYELYFCDPKGSSLAVIGEAVDKTRTAKSFDDIILMLEIFVDEMNRRKEQMSALLRGKLEADYSTFGLSPHVLIIDEYAAFAAVLSSSDKKTRDRVGKLMYEVVLQGRQLGFFLFLVMQKSDATLIDTAIRENIPLRIVLGQSGQQTYVTAFGTGIDIPSRHYSVGEGVFMEPILAPQPKLVQFPYLNFEIFTGMVEAPVV